MLGTSTVLADFRGLLISDFPYSFYEKVENISIFLSSRETTSASFVEREMSWKQRPGIGECFPNFFVPVFRNFHECFCNNNKNTLFLVSCLLALWH